MDDFQDASSLTTGAGNKSRVAAALGNSLFLFGAGLALFLLMAILGWEKLQYGFNFIDEGMYMTDAWRMTAGDRLFPDNSTNATFLYTVFNEYIFKLNPGITLYGFRKLQYCSAILAMLLLAISAYRWTREFWYLPYIFSLFAFTGLDVNGMASNFSYYTYPHLFVTLHVALLLFALKQRQGVLRDCWFALSGICLWGIGFSLLPLSVTLASPLILWLLFKRWCQPQHSFSARDIAVLYLPVTLAWMIFLAFNGWDFFDAAYKMYSYLSESRQGRTPLFVASLPYILISLLLMATLIFIGRRPAWPSLGIAGGLSAVLFAATDTNWFGVVPPLGRGWFNTQMWFASLVIATWAMVAGGVFYRCRKDGKLDGTGQLLVVLLVPSIILTVAFVFFSSLATLTVQFAAIPIMLALAVFVARWARDSGRAWAILILLLWPYYYSMAWMDWKFTYFDLPPRYLTSTFKEGFAAGIRTNELFYSMATWMKSAAREYSSDGDFAIVVDQTPMVYMLTERRPALNHSWGGLGKSLSLRRDAVAQMIRDKREPKIAFRFVYLPLFVPISIKDDKYGFGGKRQTDPADPIEGYLLSNMRHIDNFTFQQRTWVELYVR